MESHTHNTAAKPGTEPVAAAADLQRDLNRVQSLIAWTLAALLLVSGSLFIFLLREVGDTRRQNSELRQIVADYERETQPRLKQFEQRLRGYAEKDTNFMAILGRYLGGGSAAPSSSTQPDASSLTNIPPPSP